MHFVPLLGDNQVVDCALQLGPGVMPLQLSAPGPGQVLCLQKEGRAGRPSLGGPRRGAHLDGVSDGQADKQ